MLVGSLRIEWDSRHQNLRNFDLGGGILARSGELSGDLGRSGEIWRDVGVRARMASAAPSMGFRRGHIGFRQIFLNFGQKCKKMHFWRFSKDAR